MFLRASLVLLLGFFCACASSPVAEPGREIAGRHGRATLTTAKAAFADHQKQTYPMIFRPLPKLASHAGTKSQSTTDLRRELKFTESKEHGGDVRIAFYEAMIEFAEVLNQGKRTPVFEARDPEPRSDQYTVTSTDIFDNVEVPVDGVMIKTKYRIRTYIDIREGARTERRQGEYVYLEAKTKDPRDPSVVYKPRVKLTRELCKRLVEEKMTEALMKELVAEITKLNGRDPQDALKVVYGFIKARDYVTETTDQSFLPSMNYETKRTSYIAKLDSGAEFQFTFDQNVSFNEPRVLSGESKKLGALPGPTMEIKIPFGVSKKELQAIYQILHKHGIFIQDGSTVGKVRRFKDQMDLD